MFNIFISNSECKSTIFFLNYDKKTYPLLSRYLFTFLGIE